MESEGLLLPIIRATSYLTISRMQATTLSNLSVEEIGKDTDKALITTLDSESPGSHLSAEDRVFLASCDDAFRRKVLRKVSH